MKSKKDRRHSGQFTPGLTISKKELIEEDLFVNSFYNDWLNYRDSFRDWYSNFKMIKKIENKRLRFYSKTLYEKRIDMNIKQKRLLKRRKRLKKRIN